MGRQRRVQSRGLESRVGEVRKIPVRLCVRISASPRPVQQQKPQAKRFLGNVRERSGKHAIILPRLRAAVVSGWMGRPAQRRALRPRGFRDRPWRTYPHGLRRATPRQRSTTATLV
jgi:hypothetical protein